MNALIDRRELLIFGGALAASAVLPRVALGEGDQRMYGLIGKMTTAPGRREELIAILLEGTGGMPGCLSYVVARDTADADAIWITEVWDSQASHQASLALPSVKQAIERGRPLIAGFGERFVTEPVGGYGLARSGGAAPPG